jgi:peptidoglycan-associated lipoprotein
MKKIAVVLASILIVACSSTKKVEVSHSSEANEKNASSVASAASASTAALELSNLNAEIQRLQGQSDYFDYDKSAIRPEYQAVIQKQAEFIKAHKNDVVTLEGNADERGSEGYNLALGNRRAEAVFESLVNLGVSQAQIKTASFGKDKPRLSCHKEKCWKENRRVDFDHKLI